MSTCFEQQPFFNPKVNVGVASKAGSATLVVGCTMYMIPVPACGVWGVRGVRGEGTGIRLAGSSRKAGPNTFARWAGSGGGIG